MTSHEQKPHPKKHNKVNEHCRSSELIFVCSLSPRPSFGLHLCVQVVRRFCDMYHKQRHVRLLVLFKLNEKQLLPCNFMCVKLLSEHLTAFHCRLVDFLYYQNLSNSFDALDIRSELTEYFLLCNSLSLIMLQPNVTFSTA